MNLALDLDVDGRVVHQMIDERDKRASATPLLSSSVQLEETVEGERERRQQVRVFRSELLITLYYYTRGGGGVRRPAGNRVNAAGWRFSRAESGCVKRLARLSIGLLNARSCAIVCKPCY